ncbi:hypothetical protein [Myroides odoratus]|nr:hypothetical protein [Myroides odoratus]QQU04857.1 hypothetical protein I6I89_06110 [Myroides odoratus]
MEMIKSKYSLKFFFVYPLFFFLNIVFLGGLIYNLFTYSGIVFKGYFERELYDVVAIVFLLVLFFATQYYLISNCKSIEISDTGIKMERLLSKSIYIAKHDVIIQEGHDNIGHNPHTKTFTVISKQTNKKFKFREFEYKNYDKIIAFLKTEGYVFC